MTRKQKSEYRDAHAAGLASLLDRTCIDQTVPPDIAYTYSATTYLRIARSIYSRRHGTWWQRLRRSLRF